MNDTQAMIEWALIQAAEDERVARAASEPPWTVDGCSVMHSGPSVSRHADGQRLGRMVVASVGAWDLGVPTAADAEHIAHWDPGRVLKLTAALRKALDEFSWGGAERRILAGLVEALYADRDGYREEWR